MTRGAALEFSGLSKQYGTVTAVRPTDLTIAPGEFFAVLGPSGSASRHCSARSLDSLHPPRGA